MPQAGLEGISRQGFASQEGISESEEAMKYKIIYADPPWSYHSFGINKGKGRVAASHYDTMKFNDIKTLDIKSIANKDCILFLWSPFFYLRESIEVMEAWGFKYRTAAFVWVKRNKDMETWFTGMGNYTRANAELCLIATKGKGLPRQRKDIKQIIETRRGRHSEKPPEAAKRIVQLYGDVPRVELFARRKVEGWDCTGLEVDGKDIKDFLNEQYDFIA